MNWPFFERLGARVVGQWKVIDRGHMFQNPPVCLPGLPERYRPAK